MIVKGSVCKKQGKNGWSCILAMAAISLFQSKTFKSIYKKMKFSKGKLRDCYAKKLSGVILGRGGGERENSLMFLTFP